MSKFADAVVKCAHYRIEGDIGVILRMMSSMNHTRAIGRSVLSCNLFGSIDTHVDGIAVSQGSFKSIGPGS